MSNSATPTSLARFWRTAAMTVHAGGEGGAAPSFVGAAMAARGVRNVLGGAESRSAENEPRLFEHTAETSDLLVSKACF